MKKSHLINSTPPHINSQQTGNRGDVSQVDEEYLQKTTASIIFNSKEQ